MALPTGFFEGGLRGFHLSRNPQFDSQRPKAPKPPIDGAVARAFCDMQTSYHAHAMSMSAYGNKGRKGAAFYIDGADPWAYLRPPSPEPSDNKEPEIDSSAERLEEDPLTSFRAFAKGKPGRVNIQGTREPTLKEWAAGEVNGETALSHIKECSKAQHPVLNLAGLMLEKWPPILWKLVHLKELYVAGNRFTEIPPEFKQLINLKKFDGAYNAARLYLPHCYDNPHLTVCLL